MLPHTLPTPKTRPVVICMTGLPRGGKTTKALELSKRLGAPIISPDAFRVALHGQRFSTEAEPFVWAMVKVAVRALLLTGHEFVIVDATNGTRGRRDAWKDPRWDLKFCPIGTDAEECVRRAEAQNDQYIIPVIRRMAGSWEPLGPDEPVFEVSGT